MTQAHSYGCNAKAQSTEAPTDPGGLLGLSGEHNHAPSAIAVGVKKAVAVMKAKATSTRDRPCAIMQAQRERDAADAEVMAPAMPSKHAMRCAISRVRQKLRRKEPASLDDFEFPEECARTLGGEEMLHKMLVVDGEHALVVTTAANLKELGRSEMWLADGTFKTSPRLFAQMYSIHARVGGQSGQVLPMVYALMTRKSAALYTVLLEKVKEWAAASDVELAPRYVLTDFEIGAISEFRKAFSASTNKGCFFHLGQSIWRQVQKHGLATLYGSSKAFELQVKTLWALAFLPADEIVAAFAQIKGDFPSEADGLVCWFEATYVCGGVRRSRRSGGRSRPALFAPSLWSVSENVRDGLPRTQNSVEAWHNRWRVLLGKKPGVYELLAEIRREEQTVRSEVARLRSGLFRKLTERQQKREERLAGIVYEYTDRVTTLEEFLMAIAQNLSI